MFSAALRMILDFERVDLIIINPPLGSSRGILYVVPRGISAYCNSSFARLVGPHMHESLCLTLGLRCD